MDLGRLAAQFATSAASHATRRSDSWRGSGNPPSRTSFCTVDSESESAVATRGRSNIIGVSLPKHSMLSEEMHSAFKLVVSSEPGSKEALDAMEELQRRVALLERANERNAAASSFMLELTDSVETLSSIAEEHGSQTIADLMWLHNAKLSPTWICSTVHRLS